MSSFTSSFKPFAIALVAIFVIEATVFALVRPNFVERSNYLDMNYMSSEYFHKLLIYEKLKQLSETKPDIIQVGDSTGFYGIRPDVVMKYLNGMTYTNFSCCANTGFDGYYDIAAFVLERDPNAKALVLYVALDGIPRANLARGDELVGGGARIHHAFTSPWAALSPPSLALRLGVTQYVYSFAGIIRPIRVNYPPTSPEGRMAASLSINRGWESEEDLRMSSSKRASFFEENCGKEDYFDPQLDKKTRFYKKDWMGKEEFIPEKTFSRFAELARRYNAKLIIVFHPYPCDRVIPGGLDPLKKALLSLEKRYPNLSFAPADIFEHWPKIEFDNLLHLRIGYDILASHRLGKLVAATLGITPKPSSPDETGADGSGDEYPDATDDTPNLLGQDPLGRDWTAIGVAIQRIISTPPELEISETLPNANHPDVTRHIESTISNIVPSTPYVVSFDVKPIGKRSVTLVMRDLRSGRMGTFACDIENGIARREDYVYEGDIEELPDGWYRCWASMAFCTSTAVIGLFSSSDAPSDRQPAADGNGLLIRNLRMQQGWRLQSHARPSAPLLPFPITESCPSG